MNFLFIATLQRLFPSGSVDDDGLSHRMSGFGKMDDLREQLSIRQAPKRAVCTLTLDFGEGLVIGVKGYEFQSYVINT